MEISESNKLIAEFMGVEKTSLEHGFIINGVLTPTSGMKFHTSWDWLIPVVEKIISEHSNHSNPPIEPNDTVNIVRLHVGLANIKNSYKAVVQFIEWYNKTSNRYAN